MKLRQMFSLAEREASGDTGSGAILAFKKTKPIGIWGQRHRRYLKEHKKAIYTTLLTSGKLNGYLADIDEQAKKMFFRLVKQMAERESVTEHLKADMQFEWVQKMNNIHNSAMEIVNEEIIFA